MRLKRGQIVQRPDKWEQRGKFKHGKAIVLGANTRSAVLCTFNPGHKIDSSNPHVSIYESKNLKVIGKVKKMPKACNETHKWKIEFWKQHPYFKQPKSLGRSGRK